MSTLTVHRYTPTDPRLGRHIKHDSRSVQHAVGVMPCSAIKSVSWPRHAPILDQGQIGCCVPNAGTALLSIDASDYTGQAAITIPKADTKGEFQAGSTWALGESTALNFYRLVTRLDSYAGQWEPDDTGSDGLTMAKALVMLGLADVYQHAFSYAALVSALQHGPVLIGSEWEESQFTPGADGKITVDFTSGVAGGHEYVAREFDAENDRVWIDNSWGESWGLDGRAWYQGSDLTALLKRGGDVTVPHLLGAPVPPAPPTPAGPTGDEVAAKVREALHQIGV